MKSPIVKIDNLDKKILYILDQNSRQSASEIAKKCRVHKNVVNFRINRLVKSGIIRQFVAMVSPSVLGLTPYKFYFQLQNFTEERQKEIFEFIKNLPTYWSAKVSGRWDLIIGVLIKNSSELKEIKNRILDYFGEDIINKNISLLVEAPHFYRNYLIEKQDYSIKYWMGNVKAEKIDELDSKILRIFADNCRTPIIEIAEKTGVTPKTIISHIKSLEKKKIIYDYRISLNLDKLGLKFFKCFISLKKSNKEEIKKFIQYCANHKNIIHLIECVGEWDLEPEFEIESSEKFQESLIEIRNKFNHIIKTVETIEVLEEKSYICIP
jgi:Lrp/AsnC family transcriptional regulator, leucine-responsive regulatory protein